MAGMRYQPQRLARLNRTSSLLRGASVVLTGSASTNLVTGVPLAVGGTGVAKRPTPAGIADSFRKNFYKETETLPAIGTRSFVEFWYGYPSSDQGNAGLGPADPTLLTGSSAANSAIVARIGNDRPDSNSWGALYTWPSQFNSAGEALAPGRLTLLVVVRRQNGMEFWRDGVMVAFIEQSPVSLGEAAFLVGGFVQDPYWTSSSDMLLAGRVIGEWSAAEVRSFSQNPWSLFEGEDDASDDLAAPAISYSLIVDRAALAMGSGQVGMRVSRRLRAAPAAMAVTAGSIAVRAARRLRMQPAGLGLAGGIVTVRASRRLSVRPAALDVLAGQVRMAVSRRLGVQPAALAVAGQGVTLRASRRLQVAPAALVLAGGQVGMQYAPAPLPGSYRLPVSAAAMTLGGGQVGMRVTRRLPVASAQLQLAAGAARALVGRRLLVAGAGLEVRGGTVTLRYSGAAPAFDISKIHPSRLVVFEGSGSRITPFGGSGSRVTVHDGSGSRVTPFEGSGSRITRFD